MIHHDCPPRAPGANRPVEVSHAGRVARSSVINSCAVRLCALLILLNAGAWLTPPSLAAGQTPTPGISPRATPSPANPAGTPAPSPNVSPASAPQPGGVVEGGVAPAPAATATTATGQQITNPPATGQTSGAAGDNEPRVVDVFKFGEEFKRQGDTTTDAEWQYERREAGLNDIIIIKVANLSGLVNRAKCRGANVAATCRPQEIVLYIEGREIEGLTPESGAPTIEESNAEPGTLRYHLLRSEGSDEHWADLLGFSLDADEFKLHRDVEVSVGLPGEFPIKSDVKDFHLVRVRRTRLLLWLALFLILGFYLWRLARESDFLRDRKPVLWKQRKPYSLSLTQAAWWFVLVIFAFVFIWLVTGQYDLSSSVLVLLGIGFGTALGSTIIGQNRSATPTDEQTSGSELTSLLLAKDALEAELTKLDSKIDKAREADKPALAAESAEKKETYDALIAKIRQKFPEALGWKNINFHTDLISDSHGVNFHRFQMIVWTIVLGIIFVHSVLSRLSMPQFNATLLALMGISSGAYLAGKSSEPQHVTTNTGDADDEDDAAATDDSNSSGSTGGGEASDKPPASPPPS